MTRAKPHIMLVQGELDLTSGPARNHTRLARSLDKDSLTVSQCFQDVPVPGYGYEALKSSLVAEGIQLFPIRYAHPLKSPSFAGGLLRAIRSARPSIVHFCVPTHVIVGAPLAKSVGARTVYTMGTMVEYDAPWLRALLKQAFRFIDQPVAVSGAVSRDWQSRRFTHVLAPTVYSGVEMANAEVLRARGDELKRRLGIRSTHVLGTVGRLAAIKQPGYLLDAFALVSRQHDAVLVIVGDGEMRPALEDRAATLGIGDRVVFAGWQSNIYDWLGAFDVFVFHSLSEGLGTVLIEAAMAGLPIAATQIDGVNEIITSGSTGLLAPPGDPAGLAAAVLRYLRDPKLAAACGESARARAQDKFSVQTMAASYEQLYRQLLARRYPL